MADVAGFKVIAIWREGEPFVHARVRIGPVVVEVLLTDEGNLMLPLDPKAGVPTPLLDADRRARIRERLCLLRDMGDLGMALPAQGAA